MRLTSTATACSKHARIGRPDERHARILDEIVCSNSNMTTTTKKRHMYNHQPGVPSQDYPNACYQLSGSNSNGQPMGYPPPPSYAGPTHQHGNASVPSSGYPPAMGICGYSRAASPMFPHSNVSDHEKPDSCTALVHVPFLVRLLPSPALHHRGK